MDSSVLERMRADWNRRAAEDAYYYVAFGRRKQDDSEFFQTADEVLAWLRDEMRRVETEPGKARALEIGCGPGRLMRPLSASFQEIHGIDVSDRMIRLAERNLEGIEHAQVRTTSGADLSPFASQHFDFVYSYAVFQHIPSRDVVLQYLREAVRVLKTGGILTCQLNGRQESSSRATTWHGVHISAETVLNLARELDCQVMALGGVDTQYMCTTWRKRTPGWRNTAGAAELAAREIRLAGGSDRIVAGRPAAFALAIEHPDPDWDVADMAARVQGRPASVRIVKHPDAEGWNDIVLEVLPCEAGAAPVELYWRGQSMCRPVTLQVAEYRVGQPALVSLTDGVNYLSASRITSRTVKIILDDVTSPDRVRIAIDGRAVRNSGPLCISAQTLRYGWDLFLKDSFGPGRHRLLIEHGETALPALAIDLGVLQSLDVFRGAPSGERFLERRRDALWSLVTVVAGAGEDHSEALVASASALPFRAGQIAGIVFRGNPEREVLAEFRRVLKDEGALYLEVPSPRDLGPEELARESGLEFRWRRDLAGGQASGTAVFARSLLSLGRRAADRCLGTRLALGGVGFYFGREWGAPDARPRLNGCVRCGAVHSSTQLSAAGTLSSLYPLVRYRCPGCGAVNVLTIDR
jgi:ubiquinone/menaquinone biosynthesis C-methylase UbiE